VKVSQGAQVSLEFTVSLDDQTVIGSNTGEPAVFTQGSGEIFPAIEQAIEGMAVGENKEVVLQPEEAYGVVNPDAIQQVEKARVPEAAQHVGAELHAEGADEEIRARVIEVHDDMVTVDFNHPLAGKSLSFEVKVLEVTAAPSQD